MISFSCFLIIAEFVSFIPSVYADHISILTFSLQPPLLNYNFDNSIDNSGIFKNNATVSGNESYTQGITMYAFNFDGKTKIVIPDKKEMNSKSFSISLWVNPSEVKTQAIVTKFSIKDNSGWRLFMQDDGRIAFDSTQYGKFYMLTPILQAGTWSNIVATFDSNTDIARLYYNGELSSESNLDPDGGQYWSNPVDMENNYPNDLVLGFGGHADHFIGKMDDIKFFNETLSDEEIRYIYYGFYQPAIIGIIIFTIIISSVVVFARSNIIQKLVKEFRI